MKIGRYIFTLIKNDELKMYRWGFSNAKFLPNNRGLSFQVNGLKHSGFVRVEYNKEGDDFDVVLQDNRKIEVNRFRKVAIEFLLKTIDDAIICSRDYAEMLRLN